MAKSQVSNMKISILLCQFILETRRISHVTGSAHFKYNPERVSNIQPSINKYNWEGINYPSKIYDWKNFDKNNLTIVLNDSKQRKRRMALSCSKKNICITT